MNNTQLLGRICKDIELKYTGNNKAYAKFTLAVNRKFVKQGEERQADFINILVWNKTAEFCSKYFRKGSQIAVDGRIQTGSYEKDGQRIYTFEVVADSVYFAESSNKNNNSDASEPSQAQMQHQDGFYPVDDSEDDLPF